MRAAAVIAVSAVVHGGLALALSRIPLQKPLIRPAKPPELTVEVPPEPVAIEIVELPPAPPPAAATAAAPAAAAATASGSAAISRIAGSDSALPARPERGTEGPESKGGRMRMRAEGESPGLDLSLSGASDAISAILARPPRPKAPETGLLEQNRNARGGKKDTYTGHDLVFTAKVDADGHVSSFDDAPNFNYRFHIPNPRALARGAGDHIAAWSEDPYGVSTGTGSPTIARKSGEQKEPEGRVFTILSGGFDVTDAVMRWAGQDPYNARKAEFLERTFDERVEIGTVHRARQLDQADAIILRHLDQMWRNDELELADKKELVFELWDECAESGGEQLQEGGARARAALYRWVDTHLPAGSDAAFTADELDAFNDRRRSKARFAPYD